MAGLSGLARHHQWAAVNKTNYQFTARPPKVQLGTKVFCHWEEAEILSGKQRGKKQKSYTLQCLSVCVCVYMWVSKRIKKKVKTVISSTHWKQLWMRLWLLNCTYYSLGPSELFLSPAKNAVQNKTGRQRHGGNLQKHQTSSSLEPFSVMFACSPCICMG